MKRVTFVYEETPVEACTKGGYCAPIAFNIPSQFQI